MHFLTFFALIPFFHIVELSAILRLFCNFFKFLTNFVTLLLHNKFQIQLQQVQNQFISTLFAVCYFSPNFFHFCHFFTIFMTDLLHKFCDFFRFSFSEYTSAARWFIVMNYLVHSVMYSYYAFKALK